MRFSLTIATVAFALSVNAASINKRCDDDTASSAAAQTCINSLTSANQALNVLNVNAASFTSSQGYVAMINIQQKEQWVEGNITAAGTSCCAITATLATNDTTAVLSKESTLVDSYTSVINSFLTVKPQIYALALFDPLLEGDLKNLLNKTTPVLNCLTAIMPTDSTSAAQGYATSIENSLQQGITAFAGSSP